MTRSPTGFSKTRAVLLALVVVLGTIPMPAMAASSTTVELSPSSDSVGELEKTTFDVVVTNASGGVGAWEFTASVDNTTAATITDISLSGSPTFSNTSIASDNSSAYAKAAGADTTDTGEVVIATITVRGENEGDANLDISIDAVGDENGTNYDVTGTSGASLTVENANFEFSEFSVTPTEANETANITASAKVTNTGGTEGTIEIPLKVDGSPEAVQQVTLASGASTTVEFTYNLTSPGDYDIAIGQTDPITVSVNAPPNAEVAANTTDAGVNETVAVNASNSSDSDGSVDSFQWNVDNGTIVDDRGSELLVEFAEPGDHNVTVTVVDDDGATDSATVTIGVSDNTAPTAAFDVINTSGTPLVGSGTVELNASAASDNVGITAYWWTVTAPNGSVSTYSGEVASATLDGPGEHNVTLTVEDNTGKTDTRSKNVTVLVPATFSYDYSLNTTTPLTTEAVEVNATVDNTGDVEGDTTVDLKVDGSVVDTKSVTVDGHSSKTVTFTRSLTRGNHTIAVNNESTTNVTALKPADISVVAQNLTTPTILGTDPVNVTAYLNNTGDVDGVKNVSLFINGSKVQTEEVMVPKNTDGSLENLTTLNFSKNRNWEYYGNHSVHVDDVASENVTVLRSTNPDAETNITSPTSGSILGAASVTVDYTLSNVSTGIDHAEYQVDDGPWTDLADLSDGNFSASGLSDGQHTVNVSLVDNLDNRIGTSTTTFQVDTTAPVVDIGATGPVGQNEAIDIAVMSVDASPNETVLEVRNGTSVVARMDVTDEVDADLAGGSWNATMEWDGTNSSGALPTGTYQLAVVSTDEVGQTNETTTTVTVDNKAPTGDVSDVSNGDGASTTIYVNDTDTITINGTAGDATTSISSVSAVLDAQGTAFTHYASATYTAPINGDTGIWTVDVSGSALDATGNYSVGVLASDEVDNPGTGFNSTLTVVVDRTAPNLGATINKKNSSYGRINVTASEVLETTPTATLVDPNDNTTSVSLTKTGDRWTGVFEFSADGTYKVVATGTDRAGNDGSATATTKVQTNVETVNKSVRIVNDDTGTFIELHTKTDVKSAFAALTESDSPLADLSENLSGAQFIDGQLGDQLNDNLSYALIGIPVNESELPDGVEPEDVEIRFYNETTESWETIGNTTIENYTVNGTEREYYSANVSHFSTYGAVAQDTTPPSIDGSSLSPSGSPYDYNQSSVEVTVQYSDSQTGIDAGATEVWVDGTKVTNGGSFDGSLSVTEDKATIELTDLVGSGDHTVTVQPVDKAGNAADKETKTFTVTKDTTPPGFTTKFNDSQTFDYGTDSVSFSVDYTDSQSGINASSVVVTVDGTDVTQPATVTSSGVSYTATGLDEGDHTFTVNVADKAGNNDTLTRSFTIEADTAKPTVSTSLSPSPTDGTVKAGTNEIEFEATYSDSESGVDSSGIVAEFYQGDSGWTDVTDSAVITDSKTTFTGYDLDSGQYKFRITVPDQVGKSKTITETVTIGEGTAPTIQSLSIDPTPGGEPLPHDTSSVELSFDVSDTENDISNIKIDFEGSTLSFSPSFWSGTYTASGLAPDSTYTIDVTVTDSAGNKATEQLTFEVAAEPDDSTDDTGGGGGGGGAGAGDVSKSTETRSFGTIANIENIGSETASVAIGASGSGTSISELTIDAQFKPSKLSVYVYNPTDTPSTNAPALDKGESVSYFQMELREGENKFIDTATVKFEVDSSELPADTDPSQVTLYRFHDGEWQTLETRHVSDDTYEADTPGFSEFAIGVAPLEDQDDSGTDATTTTTTPTTTEDPTTTEEPATTTTTGEPTTTEEDGETSTFLPGFGPIVAIVALVAVGLLRRRQQDD